MCYTNMKDRIKQIMDTQHMTQQTFAAFIGISAPTLCSIFQGRTKPTLNIVEAIKRKMPNVHTEWLIFGNGRMFEDEKVQNTSSSTLPNGGNGEQMLNFGDDDVTTIARISCVQPISQNLQTSRSQHAKQNIQSRQQSLQTDLVYQESERRCITEIRVFYDDQTWECFVPKK